MRATPDSVFLDYGHEVMLKLTLSSEFYLPGSYVVVKLNGSELGSYSIADKLRGREGSVHIKIPAKLLVSDNVLSVLWQGPVQSVSQSTAGWISQDSEFYLPRNYAAELPAMGLLRQHLYPFSIKADFSDLLVVVPDRVNADTISALLAAAAGIGRVAPSEHVAFHVARSSELKERPLKLQSYLSHRCSVWSGSNTSFDGGTNKRKHRQNTQARLGSYIALEYAQMRACD